MQVTTVSIGRTFLLCLAHVAMRTLLAAAVDLVFFACAQPLGEWRRAFNFFKQNVSVVFFAPR